MKKVSGNSPGGVGKLPQPDPDTDDTSSSESASAPSGSHHGRSVTPARTGESEVSNIPSIISHSDDLGAVEARGFTGEPGTSQAFSVEMESRISSYKKDGKDRRAKKRQEKSKKKNPVLSAEVVEGGGGGSIEKHLESLASTVKTVQKDNKARKKERKARKNREPKKFNITDKPNEPDSTSKIKNANKPNEPNGDHSRFLTPEMSDHDMEVSEEQVSKEEKGNTVPGLFYLDHPAQNIEMTRSHLRSHLEIVEKFEAILIEVLKASGSKADIHSLDGEILGEILGEIKACLDEWMELPPKDITIQPRKELKQLIDNHRDEFGDELEIDAEQMEIILSKCRQLFPIYESGSFNKVGGVKKPVSNYLGRVSQKIKSMLKYQAN